MNKLSLGLVSSLAIIPTLSLGAVTKSADAGPSVADNECTQISESPKESESFMPYESQWSHLPPIILEASTADEKDEVQQSAASGTFYPRVDDMTLWAVSKAEDGAVQHYFVRGSGPEKTLLDEFYTTGGVQFRVEAASPDRSPTVIQATIGDRAVLVQVGNSEIPNGVLVHSDPSNDQGLRTHSLYWTDGKHDFQLEADATGAEVISMARRIACSS